MSNKRTYSPIVSDFYKYTVESFYDSLIDKTRADYGFQSRVRWKKDNKSSYITSLILGMAPSKFILASTSACKVTSKGIKDQKYYEEWSKKSIDFLNIDSNNRVTTLKEFKNNEFGIEPGMYEINGQVVEIIEGENDTFDTLPGVIKSTFLNALITVEIITAATREQLSNLFIRMNDGISLNGPEKRNAVICKFADEIRSLATEYEALLKVYFTPADINRRKVDDFIAGLALVYFHGVGYTISDKTLWSAYAAGSTEDNLVHKFVEDFRKFINTFPDATVIPNKNTVLDLFSIVKELNDNGYTIEDSSEFMDRFLEVNAELIVDETKHHYNSGRDATYKELLRSREVKFTTVRRREIDKRFDPVKYCIKRDSNRNFSKEEKFVAAVNQNWLTPEGKPIEKSKLFDPTQYHGGHKIPWADGGSTDQENLAVQTTEDNLKLGRNPVQNS